jgi:hypothetical protein
MILERTHEQEERIYSRLGLKLSDSDADPINKRFSDSEPDADHSLKTQ